MINYKKGSLKLKILKTLLCDELRPIIVMAFSHTLELSLDISFFSKEFGANCKGDDAGVWFMGLWSIIGGEFLDVFSKQNYVDKL